MRSRPSCACSCARGGGRGRPGRRSIPAPGAGAFELQRGGGADLPGVLPSAQDRCRRPFEHWSQIPALPAGAFKEFEVSSIPPADGRASSIPAARGARPRAAIFTTPGRWRSMRRRAAVVRADIFSASRPPPMKLIFLTPEDGAAFLAGAHVQSGAAAFRRPDSAFTGRVAPDGSWAWTLEQTLAALREAVGRSQPVACWERPFPLSICWIIARRPERGSRCPRFARDGNRRLQGPLARGARNRNCAR